MDIDKVWSNIVKNEGESFYQIRGKEFKYSVCGNSVKLSTTNRSISKKEIEKAMLLLPFKNTVPLQDFQAPSYLFAILMDKRMQ